MYFGPQLAILVVATTLTRITSVHSRPTNDDEFDAPSHMAKSFAEDESPDVSEQLRHHDRELEREAKKRNEPRVEKYDAPQQDEKTSAETDATTASVTISLVHMPTEPTEEPKKRLAIHIDDVDIADREDHVTQYLADLLVNTDSEITCLQASEIEDEREAVESGEATRR
uniref:Uncharacterized protein n=1 Tax=Heliothis virescens TaxID=7102 RepID=A0A2A4J0S5_HELVI